MKNRQTVKDIYNNYNIPIAQHHIMSSENTSSSQKNLNKRTVEWCGTMNKNKRTKYEYESPIIIETTSDILDYWRYMRTSGQATTCQKMCEKLGKYLAYFKPQYGWHIRDQNAYNKFGIKFALPDEPEKQYIVQLQGNTVWDIKLYKYSSTLCKIQYEPLNLMDIRGKIVDEEFVVSSDIDTMIIRYKIPIEKEMRDKLLQNLNPDDMKELENFRKSDAHLVSVLKIALEMVLLLSTHFSNDDRDDAIICREDCDICKVWKKYVVFQQ